MPTRTIYATKEQSLASVSGAARGNGNDIHCPIGKGSFNTNYIFSLLTRFPGDWSGMTQVTKVELKFKLTTEIHTAQGSSRRILVSRLVDDFSSGGGSENSWAFGSGVGSVYPGPNITTSYQNDRSLTSWDAGQWVTIDITAAYRGNIPNYVLDPDGNPGVGGANNGFRIESYDDSSVNRSCEFYGMDSGSPYYIVITYTTNTAPTKPVITAPAFNTVLAPGVTPVFSWTGTDPDAGDTLLKCDIQVTPDDVFTSAFDWNAVGAGAINVDAYKSGFNVTGLPYGGSTAAFGDGQTRYVRVRNYDAAGVASPWSNTSTFRIGAVPVISGQVPANAALADIWNLDDLAVWDATGRWAKPIFQFVWAATNKELKAYRLRTWNAADVVQDDYTVTLPSTLPPGSTVTVNSRYAVIMGTTYKWSLEAQDTDGNWSAVMAHRDFRVRWGQAIYAHQVFANAQNLKFVTGALGGAGARLSTMFQTSGDNAGATTPSAWFTDIGSTLPTQAYVRVCVRLSTPTAGVNPTLADMTLTYLPSAAGASLPDKWTLLGSPGSLSLDSSIRRFGYYSAKLTSTTVGTSVYIVPWRRLLGDGVIVTQNTDYVFSMYIKTPPPGPLGGAGSVQLHVRLGGPGGTVSPMLPQPVGTTYATSDSSKAPDGWQRLMVVIHVPPGVTQVWPSVWFQSGANGQSIWVDGGKFEEGKVASAWTPGFLGEAITLDAMGITVEGKAGGIFRLRGTNGAVRDTVELGTTGLLFGTDTQLNSPSTGVLAVNGVPLATTTGSVIRRLYTAVAAVAWNKPAGLVGIDYEVCAGGGSSGGVPSTAAGERVASGGGGGGGYSKGYLPASALPAVLTITTGGGGAAPAAGNNAGNTGGTSSIVGTGVNITAIGGGGGGSMASTTGNAEAGGAGGAGGTASGGEINVNGDDGARSSILSGVRAFVANGGGTPIGPQTRGALGDPLPGGVYGGGGGGASSSTSAAARAGGVGAPGVVIITERY